MPIKSQLFSQFPWIGGLNTSVDPGQVAPNQLIQADNVVFSTSGSRRKRDGIDFSFDDATATDVDIVGGFDYWYDSNGVKNQIYVVVKSNGVIEKCTTSGARTQISSGAQVQEITVQAKSNFSDADYFLLDSASGTDYFVWYDTTGSGVAPSVSGRTGIEVSASDAVSASDVALATATALDASSDFVATSSGAVVTITDSTAGKVGDAEDGSGLSGFIYTVTQPGGSNWTSPAKVSFVTFNNRLFLAADGPTNKIKVWDGSGTCYDLEDDPLIGEGVPPNASLLGVHLGRMWTNEKTRPDRIHYCETFNHLEWQGYGDSGAIDVGLGDGDPEGITAIFPPFRGALHVAKKTKLYRIVNQFPETFQVITVTGGLGCVSHNSVATVDQTDIIFVSLRGVHSLVATNEFGDFNSRYLSADIQKTFTDEFDQSNLELCQALYLSQINSYVFAVTDNSVNSAINSAVYLYNIPLNSWYRWTLDSTLSTYGFRSIWKARDSDRERFYIGSRQNKIGQALTGNFNDTAPNSVEAPILFIVKTGFIYVDQNIYSQKAFKRFSLVYAPIGAHEVTVSLTIDDFDSQALSYTGEGEGAALNVDFILDQSILEPISIVNPQTISIEGLGRGVQITITQTGLQESIEIQGFHLEFVSAGRIQQTSFTTAGGDT